MVKKIKNNIVIPKLRERAEKEIETKPHSLENMSKMSAEDIMAMIYEFEVQQSELKIQNDELLRIQIEL